MKETKFLTQCRKENLKFKLIKLKYSFLMHLSVGKKRQEYRMLNSVFEGDWPIGKYDNSLPDTLYYVPTDIVMYDLLPKTELQKTKKRLIKLFKKNMTHKYMFGGKAAKYIDELITGIDQTLHNGDSWYEIGLFDFAKSKKLDSSIHCFKLRLHNYSSSYAALEVRIMLSDSVKSELSEFIKSDYKKPDMEAHRYFVRNKGKSGAKAGYAFGSGASNEYAKNRILFEQLELIKYRFLKKLTKYFPLVVYSLGKQLQSIYVFETNISPDRALSHSVYTSLGIHDRYGFNFSPAERLYVSADSKGSEIENKDMIYVYNKELINDFKVYSTENNKAVMYLTDEYLSDLYRIFVIKILGLSYWHLMSLYRNRVNKLKTSRFSLSRLLKTQSRFHSDLYAFSKIDFELSVDKEAEKLTQILEKNSYAVHSIYYHQFHPYKLMTSVPRDIWSQVKKNKEELENDLSLKIEIASEKTAFSRERSNRRISYYQLILAILTFIMLLYPKCVEKFADSITCLIDSIREIVKWIA